MLIPIHDRIPSRRFPFVMYALIAANAAVFVYQLTLSERDLVQLIHLYGIVPRRYFDWGWARDAGYPGFSLYPFVATMFLHGGFFHLMLNMWTLWIFGDNVEDRMGALRFTLFYLLCGLAAGIAHTLFNPGSAIPAVGASGAIAGVLAAYLLMYPFAKIVCIFPIFIIPFFVDVPAILFGIFWFSVQILSGTAEQDENAAGIAWWAHIGGFMAGVFLCKTFVKYPPQRRDTI